MVASLSGFQVIAMDSAHPENHQGDWVEQSHHQEPWLIPFPLDGIDERAEECLESLIQKACWFRTRSRYHGGYDHIHGDNAANQVTGNLILGTNVGDLQPYVLGGVGYRWADVDEAVWNLGAGAKVALTEKIDFDARYRYVQGFETEHSDNVVTGGLVFKF